jgi:hypothetical protein
VSVETDWSDMDGPELSRQLRAVAAWPQIDDAVKGLLRAAEVIEQQALEINDIRGRLRASIRNEQRQMQPERRVYEP